MSCFRTSGGADSHAATEPSTSSFASFARRSTSTRRGTASFTRGTGLATSSSRIRSSALFNSWGKRRGPSLTTWLHDLYPASEMNVYFVCVGNAGRSQMAQAFADQAGLSARSAGSRPENELHPEVVAAMDEVGIDLRGRSPKGISDED